MSIEEENKVLQQLLRSSTFTHLPFMDNSHTPHVHGPSCNHGHNHEHEGDADENGQDGSIGE